MRARKAVATSFKRRVSAPISSLLSSFSGVAKRSRLQPSAATAMRSKRRSTTRCKNIPAPTPTNSRHATITGHSKLNTDCIRRQGGESANSMRTNSAARGTEASAFQRCAPASATVVAPAAATQREPSARRSVIRIGSTDSSASTKGSLNQLECGSCSIRRALLSRNRISSGGSSKCWEICWAKVCASRSSAPLFSARATFAYSKLRTHISTASSAGMLKAIKNSTNFAVKLRVREAFICLKSLTVQSWLKAQFARQMHAQAWTYRCIPTHHPRARRAQSGWRSPLHLWQVRPENAQ